MPETEVESNGHKEQEYQEFLEQMQAQGFPVGDGSDGGQPMIQPPEIKHTNASLLASIPDSKNIYEKNEKIKSVVLDLMNRTKFDSFEQLVAFEEYVDWCEEFGTGYDKPLRYLAGMPSIQGRSREEYLQAISNYMRPMNFNRNQNNGNQFKPKYKEGELS